MNKDLTNVIYKHREKKFQYGQFDCCIFVGEVLEEYWDIQIPKWRKFQNYSNIRSSLKTLKKLGATGIHNVLTVLLDTPRLETGTPHLGAPVYYINETGQGILGICNGVRSYFVAEDGLTTRSTKDCKYHWRIK